MMCSGRLWQLLCNYVQERQTNMRTKTVKRKKKRKNIYKELIEKIKRKEKET